MKITKNNYESIFLDYHEGNLSVADAAELFSFLENHPELKEEFEQFELVFLPEEISPVVFPEKERLKREQFPTKENINEWLIAEIENDLTLQERSLLLAFLKLNPALVRDRELFSKTKMVVDYKEVFTDKSSLKKKIISPVTLRRIWYAAAAFILIVGAWYVLEKQKSDFGITPLQRAATESSPQNKTANSQAANENPDAAVKNSNTPSLKENNNVAQISSPEINKVISQKKQLQNKFSLASKEKSPGNNLANPENNRAPDELPIAQRPITVCLSEDTAIALVSPKSKEEQTIFSTVNQNSESNLSTSFFTEVKDKAVAALNNITGGQEVITSENKQVLPLKSRLIKMATQFINRASGNHVKVKTTFDPFNGNLAAYEVEMGKNKWQKQF